MYVDLVYKFKLTWGSLLTLFLSNFEKKKIFKQSYSTKE